MNTVMYILPVDGDLPALNPLPCSRAGRQVDSRNYQIVGDYGDEYFHLSK